MLATGPRWPPETGSNTPDRLRLRIDLKRVRGFDLAARWSSPIRFGIRWGKRRRIRADCPGSPPTTEFLYLTGTVPRSDPPFWTDGPEFTVLVSDHRSGGVGGGGGNRWRFSLWACPLPTAGTMAFVCSGWPDLAVPPDRAEVDTAPRLDAAKRAVDLWSDDY
jgi:hypothetical protein